MAYGDFKFLIGRRKACEKICMTKIQNMMDIKGKLFKGLINFLIKNLLHSQINLLPVVLLKIKICKTKN